MNDPEPLAPTPTPSPEVVSRAWEAVARAWPEDDLLLQVATPLLLDVEPGARIRLLRRQMMIASTAHGLHTLCLVRHREPPEALADALREASAGDPHRDLVLLGGPVTARALAEASHPRLGGGLLSRAARTHHLADDGQRWSSAPEGHIARALDQLGANPAPVPAARRDALLDRIRHDAPLTVRAEEQRRTFEARLGARQAPATRLLLFVIGVVFALEWLWGGAETAPTLLAMGALHPPSVHAGEIWRLGASTLLHGSILHLLFNGMVLYSLGTLLEKVLGTPRFLVLYGASALGGSLMSVATLGDHFGVGASGALWGLLAAEAVLAYRPSGLLPPGLLPMMKQAALANLALNVVNSLRPNVDWAAHLGGGLVAAALLLSGALLNGLPPLDAEGDRAAGHTPRWVTPTGGLLMALLAVAGLTALAVGQPWRLGGRPELRLRDVPEAGVVLLTPAVRVPTVTRPDGQLIQVTAGELLWDAGVVEVLVGPLIAFGVELESPLADNERRQLLQEASSALVGAAIDEADPSAARFVDVGGTPTLRRVDTSSVTFRTYQLAFIRADHLVRVEVISWAPFADAWDGVAEQVTLSLRLTPAVADPPTVSP